MGTDQKKKEGVQVKNDAETLCYQVEKQLSELKDKMSTADAAGLKEKLTGVRELLTGDSIEDADLVREKMKDLQDLSWKVTQQAYQSSSDESSEDSKESKFAGPPHERAAGFRFFMHDGTSRKLLNAWTHSRQV